MQLTVNGEIYETSAATLCSLLQELHIPLGRVAVEVNRKVIQRAEIGQYQLCEGDVVEIVNFVGGG
jgi:thiamine biosynthesis protein ThiS